MAFELFLIPHDHESAQSWLQQTKDFRLFALKTAPDAFQSTYAREIDFADDVWYHRLANPDAFTFVALQSSRIVGSLVLVGPLPYLPEEHSPLANPWLPPNGDSTSSTKVPPDAWHGRINAMFVLPEARGQGVAKALIERSMEFGLGRAVILRKTCLFTIVVDGDNIPAKSLYKKCGYVIIRREASDPGSTEEVLLMKCTPKFGASA